MKRKRPLGPAFALIALSAAGLVAIAGPAEGGPMDDGVPSGTIAFFAGGACPAGWQTATTVQGRLVVGVVDGANVGVTVGVPLTDQEDRQHQHTYATSVTLASDNIAAADGSTDNGAAAQLYLIAGTTDMAATGLPFVQVQPCVKQ
jgi:hypothetical protein